MPPKPAPIPRAKVTRLIRRAERLITAERRVVAAQIRHGRRLTAASHDAAVSAALGEDV